MLLLLDTRGCTIRHNKPKTNILNKFIIPLIKNSELIKKQEMLAILYNYFYNILFHLEPLYSTNQQYLYKILYILIAFCHFF